MNADQIQLIKSTLEITSQELAKALGVAPVTVSRWEAGVTTPTGLQAEVLQGLYNVAITARQRQDAQQAELIRGLLLLGIGALIFYLLSQKTLREQL